MQRLYFGERARQRARRRNHTRRVAVTWAVVTVVAGGLGFTLPGMNQGTVVDKLLQARLETKMPVTGLETSAVAASALEFRQEAFDRRPSPAPSPTAEPSPAASASDTASAPESAPAPAPAGSVTEIIYAAAARYGVSGDWMVAIAQCESGLNPQAYNPAGYHGLFQFDETTWAEFGSGSIYDPAAQADATARLLAAGQSSRWPSCA